MGVLVDTSVWVDHFQGRNDHLVNLLERDLVMTHPLIVGEIACGTPPNRAKTLADLSALQSVQQASMREVMDFIERNTLYAMGCAIVDLTLITSTLMTPATLLWTLDKRLATVGERMGIFYQPVTH